MRKKQAAEIWKVKVSPWRINSHKRKSQAMTFGLAECGEDCGRELQPTEREICTHIVIKPHPALPVFLSLTTHTEALILLLKPECKYWLYTVERRKNEWSILFNRHASCTPTTEATLVFKCLDETSNTKQANIDILCKQSGTFSFTVLV